MLMEFKLIVNRTMKSLISVVICIFIVSCNINKVFHLNNCEFVLIQSVPKIDLSDYSTNLRTLRHDLDENKLPIFLQSECFACNCFVSISNAHGGINCFESLLDSLNYSQIKTLYALVDSGLLSKRCAKTTRCRSKNESIPTMWETIRHVKSKKELLKSKNFHYLKEAVIDQIGLDTNGYYIREIKLKNKRSDVTLYKFARDGTYKEYWFEPNSIIVNLESRLVSEGQFYISNNGKTLQLEQIYPDSSFSKYYSTLYTFDIKNNNIILLSRWSSLSDKTQKFNKIKYKNYSTLELKCREKIDINLYE